MPPLDELRAISDEIGQASNVEQLRPLFHRVAAIARDYATDFDVTVAADQARRKLLERANELATAPPLPLPPTPKPEPPKPEPPKPEPPKPIPPKPVPPPPTPAKPEMRRVRGPWVVAFMGVAAVVMLAYAGFLFYRVTQSKRPAPAPPIVVAIAPPKPEPPRGAVRVLSDLEASVALDDRPAAPIQDGQFGATGLTPGPHKLSLVARGSSAALDFEIKGSEPPALVAPPSAANAVLVAVASGGGHAKVYSPAPAKVALDGEARGEAGPGGLALEVAAGDHTLVVGDRRLTVTLTDTPSLTVFLKKLEVTTGMLVISTGEDDATVKLNGKDVQRKWSNGSIRVPALGDLTVHVEKRGFLPVDDQRVTVKRGEEAKLTFHLKPVPKFAMLQLRGLMPGTEVWLEGQSLGRAGADGSLSAANLPPGNHTFELRREGFATRRLQRALKAGETTAASGAEVALVASTGSLQVRVTPASATVTFRKTEETQSRPFDPAAKLDPGGYVVTAAAAGFETRSVPVTVAAGETRTAELTLTKVEPPKPRVAVSWAGWSKEGNEFVRQGGNRAVVINAAPPGVLRFTGRMLKGGGVFRGSKLRWFIDDDKGTTVYEIDRRKFQARGPDGTHAEDTPAAENDDDPRPFPIEIEVTPDTVVSRVLSHGRWITLDSRPVASKVGVRFGFLVQASDQVAVQGLSFQPK